MVFLIWDTMHICAVLAQPLLLVGEVISLIMLWGEYNKTVLRFWILVIQPFMPDVMMDMLCLIANTFRDWRFQPHASSPAGR